MTSSRPIHGFWIKTIPSTCIKGDNILIVPGSINAVLDAFIIALVSLETVVCPKS